MKQKSTRLLATTLASAILLSVGSLGAYAADTSAESPAEPQPAAAVPAAGEKAGEIPPILYGVRITDTDDYLAAVRATMSSNADIKSAIDAVNNYVPEVDLTTSPYFPAMGNQGGVNSCGAWANVYYQFTYQMNKALKRTTTPENTFQPMFVYSLVVGGNNEGTAPWDLYEILHHAGCATFATLPDGYDYVNWNADFDTWREASNYRVSSYMYYENIGYENCRVTDIKDADIEPLKATLRNGDIISYTSFVGSYRSIKLKAASGRPELNKGEVGKNVVTHQDGDDGCHALTIVGYNDNIWTDINGNNQVDAGEMGAFKIINSWGDYNYAPFDHGFCWLAYDALNQESAVKNAPASKERHPAAITFVKLNVDPNFKSSNIYLKYTLNTSDRADSHLEISAKRKSDGVTFTRSTAPYFQFGYQKDAKALNYSGTTGFGDGTMIIDLDNVIPGLNSNTFHDYEWSVAFVDSGRDNDPLTVKSAVIVDEQAARVYKLNSSFSDFKVNNNSRRVTLKPYYHFSKLSAPAQSELTVGTSLRFTAKTANETIDSTPIKYTFNVYQNGQKLFSKVHKASSVDKEAHSSVIKASYKPTKAGVYQAEIIGTDASGTSIRRVQEFRVYNKALSVRSISLSTGKYIGSFEKVKITPLVTGGKAPYTYSYYYEKGGKTYKIAENTKSSSKTKQFSDNAGVYKIIVKVKDADGKTAQATQSLRLTRTTISRINKADEWLLKDRWCFLKASVKNASSVITKDNYSYTVEKGGRVQKLSMNNSMQACWYPTEDGDYTVTLTITYNGKTVASYKEPCHVGPRTQNTVGGMRKINVNVIDFIYGKTDKSRYQIHYWGGTSGEGDKNCTFMNATTTKNVGFWNTAQSFYKFCCDIPADATGYKFHIGDRWFPDGMNNGDGSTATSNTVYVFDYDFDRAFYTRE